MTGTAFNSFFGGGTAHLFWRDPAIGLFGPIASLSAGNGQRLGGTHSNASHDAVPTSRKSSRTGI